eukprot:TRINITY_DN3111_c0_g1_i1.p1 TRINITY_DN3111_c0_g1~~TRINITY_DN3111_c0_g1_i1.p1  ORF type:complete len:382 (+),score=141.83 TRINITY_DN3111_c0_g1_i1:695-1840(+)
MSNSWQEDIPHRRFNPLTQSYVLCSPHRAKRPWLGQLESTSSVELAAYDAGCYLCPGNQRAAAAPDRQPARNDHYTGTFAFDNDFAALLPPDPDLELAPAADDLQQRLLQSHPVSGRCRVMCFDPRHNVTLAEMQVDQLQAVVAAWTAEYQALSAAGDVAYVQIFENKGAVMGCSNPHPHCQLWASSTVPNEPRVEQAALAGYRQAHGGCCLLCDYGTLEMRQKVRLVADNDSFVALVPFWAVWPFELLVLAKQHVGNLTEFSLKQQRELAEMLKLVTTKYDNLFCVPFPYSMGIHQTPVVKPPAADAADAQDQDGGVAHFHMHFYPPLLRSASVKKFMVGYELLAEAQRDITAEQSAARLRQLDGTLHYKHRQPPAPNAT